MALVFNGYVFQGWMTGPANILVFLGPTSFGENTRFLVPLEMILKVFKEMDIAGYLVIRWQ